MLIFRRGNTLKAMEDGLRWRVAGRLSMPELSKMPPEGVFIQLPVLYGGDQTDEYIRAIGAEAGHVLGDARPSWIQIRGEGIYELAVDKIRAVAQAVNPAPKGVGLELNPAMLEPGAVAGYRSIGVERFHFKVDAPNAEFDEPVRRARALGAFASVEVRYGGALTGRAFHQAVERGLAAAPNQLCISDERSRGTFGTEQLERAGQLCEAAGYHRHSVWVWLKNGSSFDTLGLLLTGRGVELGPGAVSCRPGFVAGPDLKRWLQMRLAADFSMVRAETRTEHWLALAAGLYALELKRDLLDCKMLRHVSVLERMHVIDKKGHPSTNKPMEFCHRAARAARQVVTDASREGWAEGASAGSATAAGGR